MYFGYDRLNDIKMNGDDIDDFLFVRIIMEIS